MQVEDLPPYLLAVSVQGREALYGHSTSLKCHLVLMGEVQCSSASVVSLRCWEQLFYVPCFLLIVNFLSIYIAIRPCDHLL